MKITRQNFIRLLVGIPLMFVFFVFIFSTIQYLFWINRNDTWFEKEGDKFYAKGEYSMALTNYLKAETLNKKNGSVQFKLGKIFLDKNIILPNFDFDGALEKLENSKKLGYESDEMLIYLSQTYILLSEMNINNLQTSLSGSDLEDIKTKIKNTNWKEKAKNLLAEATEKNKNRSAEFFFAKGQVDLLNADEKFSTMFETASQDFQISYDKSKNLNTKLHIVASIFPVNSARGYDLLNEIMFELSKNQQDEIFIKSRKIRDIYIQFSSENEVQRFFEFGQVFLETGFDKTAAFFFNKSLEKNPKYTPSYILLGIASYNIGDLITSESSLSTALEFQKFNAEINYFLAKTKEKSGEYEDAIKEYKKAIDEKFYSEKLFLDFGNLYLKINSKTEAENIFKQGLTVNPANPDLHVALLKLLISQKRFTDAEIQVDEIKKTLGENSFYFDYAKLLLLSREKNLSNEALNFAESALLKKAPNTSFLSEVYFYKARSFENLGKNNDAKIFYIKALDADFEGIVSSEVIERLEKIGLKDEKKDFWWWLKKIT